MDEIPGHLTVSFTGGEPLLHPDVADFIAYAKGKHRLCMLTTNGWMLAKQAQALCKAGLDVLVVSVDGPKDIHNMIRGGKSFERLVGGLETILRQPKRPIVFVTMVISDLNYDKLIPMYELAKSWGTDGINFNHLWMQTDKMVAAFNSQFSIFAADEVAWEIRPKAVNVEQLADGLETIRRRSRGGRFVVTEIPYLNHQEIAVWYQKPEQFIKYDTTRCAWIRIKVWPDGKVKPCRGWQAGDIAEQQAMEVWNGQKFGDFRQTLATHGTLPICARCCYMAYR